MKRWINNVNLQKLILEATLIIFSVLLALFLNEYRTRLKEDSARAVAEENIREEIIRNRDILQEYIPYHAELLDTLQAVIRSDSLMHRLTTPIGPDLRALAPKGLMHEFPNNAAWETLRNRDLISGVNYDLLYVLTDVYNQQTRTIGQLDDIIDIVLSREAFNPQAARETLVLLNFQLGEMVGRERLLLEKYEKVLELLDAEDL